MIRLTLYYALHSFINQIRKLFKSWILIFIVVCFALGIVIGLGAAAIEDAVEKKEGTQTEEEIEIEEIEEQTATEDGWFELMFGDVETDEVVELIVGLIIIVSIFMEAIGADKSGNKIFLPADVNLLFASPMKPQAVLMFRLMGQMGTALIMSVYMIFQIPNLVINLGVGIWVAVGFLLTWCLTLMVSKLIQVFLYTVTSTYTNTRKYLRKVLYALMLVIAGSFCIYVKMTGVNWGEGAVLFFNNKGTWYIPLWGWLKGFCMSVYAGNTVKALLFLAVLVIASVLFAVAIWNLKADFYEEAMKQSEETAELLEVAAAENATGVVRRKKDRSEKIRRDIFKRGSGANVFFYRSIYNRFRFAHFGFLTKTTETYVVMGVGAAAICKFALQTDGVLIVMLTLGVLAFYRSMGNPVGDDTSKSFFLLIPESTMSKLWWSILGGTVNCLLDVLPAILLADLILLVNPLKLLMWIPLILSIDFYASTVSTFINISTPANAGKMLKQLVLILFIYFGLIPDVAIFAVGIVFEHVLAATIISSVFNMGIGCLFLGLSAAVMTSTK